MSENDYKELNNYLNETFIYLDKKVSYMLSKIFTICVLNDKISDFLAGLELNGDFEESKLTCQEILDLSKKIINTIKPEYIENIDKLVQNGVIDFSFDQDYFDSHVYYDYDLDYIELNINRYYSYDDVATFIHEYFHYLSVKEGPTKNLNVLGEFFSIYFETYAKKYMKEQNISISELDVTSRLKSTYEKSKNFKYFEVPMLTYYYFGNISEESYRLLIGPFVTEGYAKETFNCECFELLKYFRASEKEYRVENFEGDIQEYNKRKKYSTFFENYFKYFLGTIFAYYAIDNCDINDILYVFEHVNDEDFTLNSCFQKMKIDFSEDDFCEKVIESITKYASDYNIEKVKSI